MNTETKKTTASIRIALSKNYSTFEVAVNLENPNGLSVEDIEAARVECQSLAINALNDYIKNPAINVKDELKDVEARLSRLKQSIEKQPKELPDNATVEDIAKLPMYGEDSKESPLIDIKAPLTAKQIANRKAASEKVKTPVKTPAKEQSVFDSIVNSKK